MDCLFCKIIAGEVPSDKVYEDEDTLAFLDINPVKPGHTLVVPKQHFANLEEITDEQLAKVMSTVKKVGESIKNGLGVEGYNVTENNDPIAGQVIPHIHFHIIPRKEDDGIKLWPGTPYEEGEDQEILSKIRIF
ncbi:HIT family protein [Candidatus Parcubacteria bacterium]|nr:MAG: HIT family protein [Candidatus Parcubacteria bacterium]